METDPTVDALRRLFCTHPIWLEAAGYISEGACSNVAFTHLSGEVWHLRRRGAETLLEPGAIATPDFEFRFSPPAVEGLDSVSGGIGDFALELFRRFEHRDPAQGVGIRVVASWHTLRTHGYLRLLLAGGPKLAALAMRQGIRSPLGVKKLVDDNRAFKPSK